MDLKSILGTLGSVAGNVAKGLGQPNAPIAQAGRTMFGAQGPVFAQQVTDQAITDGAQAVEEAPAKPTFLQKLGKVAGGLLGKVAPIAASFIPGVGPIASKILSTLNDDEWFGEFASAGATFNEMLALSIRPRTGATYSAYSIVGAVARVETEPFAAGGASYWSEQLLPSILAYVREKTNNVLNGQESDYWTAFITATKLYAIMYQGMKYIEISKHLPLNIPNLPSLLSAIKPARYSQMVGVIEALRDYLKTTVKIPYALAEYLRWRFGTAFKSSNTGKPGIILYDYPAFAFDIDPDDLDTLVITPLKNSLVGTGRCVADIKLAYNDHAIRYDVEESHYDEKEFCLRSNMWSSLTTAALGTFDSISLYMDSRLAPSEALQAVTISTNASVSAQAPFYVSKVSVAWYQDVNIVVPYLDISDSAQNVTSNAGWKMAQLPTGLWSQFYFHTHTVTASTYNCRLAGEELAFTATRSSEDSAAMECYLNLIALHVADSLEFHGFLSAFDIYDHDLGNINSFYINRTLAYDTALVTRSQISAIQRTAMRNLTRGTYKVKKPIATRPDIKEAVSDVVEVVSDEMKDKVKAE